MSELVWFTTTAAATGAVPVPVMSAAIIAQNGAMVARLGSVMGVEVTAARVAQALGFLGVAHFAGRELFMAIARTLGWGVGPLGLGAVALAGASTAALQTWMIGQVVIAIAENGGELPTRKEMEELWKASKKEFEEQVLPQLTGGDGEDEA